MRFHGKLYLPLLFAVTGLIGGCHSSVLSDIPGGCPDADAKLIQITAVIDNPGAHSSSESSTKAAVPGTVTDTGGEAFKPEVESPLPFESRVDDIYVYVFKASASETDTPVSKLYLSESGDQSSAPRGFTALALKKEGTDRVSFVTQLPPGKYEFYFLVNDPTPASVPLPVDKAGLRMRPLHTDTYGRPVFTDYYIKRNGMPMLGQQIINVPSGSNLTPYPVEPDVRLERIFAKVEFYLTTSKLIKDSFTGASKEVFINPSLERVTQPTYGIMQSFLRLCDRRRTLQNLLFFPREGEFSATPGLLSSGKPEPVINYTSQGPAIQEGGSNDYMDLTHSILGKKRIKMVRHEKSPTIFYVAPFFYTGATERDMPYLVFNHGMYDAENRYSEKEYKIPIYTLVNGSASNPRGTPEYTIRRNTVYRFDATFKGDELVVKLDILDQTDGFTPKDPVNVPTFN